MIKVKTHLIDDKRYRGLTSCMPFFIRFGHKALEICTAFEWFMKIDVHSKLERSDEETQVTSAEAYAEMERNNYLVNTSIKQKDCRQTHFFEFVYSLIHEINPC